MKTAALISLRTILIGVLVIMLLPGCYRQQQDLSILNIFQTTVTEPTGTRWIVFSESGGVATPLLPFTIGREHPTLFVQTELPGGNMQVAIADPSGGNRSDWVPDLFGPHAHASHAYDQQRTGNFMILMETTGSNLAPPNRLYVAPAP